MPDQPVEKHRFWWSRDLVSLSRLRNFVNIGKFKMDIFYGCNMPKERKAYYTLSDICRGNRLNQSEVIRDAACGGLRLFVKVPPDIVLSSGHEDAVKNRDPSVNVERFIRRVKVGSEMELQPVSMEANGVFGLFLSRGQCWKLVDGSVELNSFEGAFRLYPGGRVEVIEPRKGHFSFRDSKNLSDEGWRILAYRETQKVTFIEGVGFTRPYGFCVHDKDIFVLHEDIFSRLEECRRGSNIRDYFEDNFIENGSIAIRNFYSEKLEYVAGVFNEFFSAGIPEGIITSTDVRHKIEDALRAHNFLRLINEKVNSERMIGLLVDALLPIELQARGVRAEGVKKYNLSKDIMVVFIAARKFWGRPDVDLSLPETHPSREKEVIPFFRNFGFSNDIAGSYAALIRPESLD